MQIKQEKGHYTLYKENEAIGMAVVDGATILRLEIVPEWRGRGYGSYLVKELLRRAGPQAGHPVYCAPAPGRGGPCAGAAVRLFTRGRAAGAPPRA